MSKHTVEMKCPYCGTTNKKAVEVEDAAPQFIHCDLDHGGCDRMFVFRPFWSVTVDAHVGAVPWEGVEGEQTDAQRTVWVAERGEACAPEYLTMENEVFAWTTDIHAAIQGSRREDIERLVEGCEDCQRICDHVIG